MYIVIVSTDKTTNSALEKMLSSKGHVVKTYTETKKAYDSIMITKPDLCIIDVELDENHTGPTLVGQIREIYQNRVVFIYIINDIIPSAVYIDNIKPFIKPFNLNVLYEYINTLTQ